MDKYYRLLKYLKPHLGTFILATVFMVLSSLFGGISLGMIVPLVDKVLSGKEIVISSSAPEVISDFVAKVNAIPSINLLNILAAFFVTVFLLRAVFLFSQSYLMNDVSHKVVRDLRNALYGKLLKLSLNFYGKSHTGTLVSRITYDTTIVRDSISEALTDLIYQGLQVLVAMVALVAVTIIFAIPWQLILIMLVLLPSVIFPVVKIGKKIKKISHATQEKMADLNTALYETISGISIVKAFGMEKYELKSFRDTNQGFYRVIMKSIKRMIGISPFTEFVGVACTVIVIWFGGREVIAGTLSPGAFVTFLAALLSMIKPFKRLSRIHSVNQQALAAATRVFQLMDEEETVQERPGAVSLGPMREGISLEGVSFKYDENEILKDINLEVKKGEIIAIVGPSGVGKTTLVNLIPRFYDPTAGRIRVDNHDVREATLASLREKIGLVTQDTFLFHDTVKMNISYGNSGVTEEKIVDAAKRAFAHEFIMAMPKGYDTLIGERGFKLSGGEKQRLAIARALLKNPPILILDEATSQLDSESERLVQEAIDTLMRGRTVFVIAHRLSTIKNAARIIVLEKGRIAEAGNHEELIQKGGLYSKYYNLQFKEKVDIIS